jgi:hypothetical protein
MSDILQEIANNLKVADAKSKQAKQLIDFAKSAGEDTVKLESQLVSLDIKADRWRKALKEQGIIVEK